MAVGLFLISTSIDSVAVGQLELVTPVNVNVTFPRDKSKALGV